ELEAAAQVVPAGGEMVDVILDYVRGQRRERAVRELETEEDLLPAAYEKLVGLVDPVEQHVPEHVVDRGDLECRRVGADPGQRGLGDGQVIDAVREIGGQGIRVDHPGVVAEYRVVVVPEGRHQAGEIGGDGRGVVPGKGFVGQAHAALVDRDHPVVPGEFR